LVIMALTCKFALSDLHGHSQYPATVHAAMLMPPAEGRRWLAEAESFLAEAPPALRRGAIGSYLASTPR
jgi:hypothetical protein